MVYTCEEDGLIGVVHPPGMLQRNNPDATTFHRLCLEHCEWPDVVPGILDEAEGARAGHCVADNIAHTA